MARISDPSTSSTHCWLLFGTCIIPSPFYALPMPQGIIDGSCISYVPRSAGFLLWFRLCLWDAFKWVLAANFIFSGSAGGHMVLVTCYQWSPCFPEVAQPDVTIVQVVFWSFLTQGGGRNFLTLRITDKVIKLKACGCPLALTYRASLPKLAKAPNSVKFFSVWNIYSGF